MDCHLDELEKQVMNMLLSGDDDVLIKLREQYRTAKVISRECSDCGFYIDYEVEDKTLNIDTKTFQLGDVNGYITNTTEMVGFVLFIKNGFLSMLEGYTYDNAWPQDNKQIVLKYRSDNRTDYLFKKIGCI